jgi:hypothetical protein
MSLMVGLGQPLLDHGVPAWRRYDDNADSL